MNKVRVALTACLLAFATAVAYRAVIAPWNINESKKAIQRTTEALANSGNPLGAVSTIRRNLERLDTYIGLTPADVELYMLRAANLRLTNRTDDAIRDYRAALDIDRRPEIYFNLGLVQLEAGHKAEAIENLTVAVRFRNDYLYLIPDISVRDAVDRKTGTSI